VCVFRPLVGTDYAHVPPPRTDDLVPVFARLYEACMERGLPIGCAPDIHVSLVLLPEEARTLTTRRFPVAEAKRRALKTLVGWHVRRRLHRFDRSAPKEAR
jgi:hypothetical protein